MIKEVLIHNFKCFKKLIIPEFGRINLIAGRNNVGKTSLLEAIFLYHDRERPDKFLRQFAWRGMKEVSPDFETTCRPYFYDNDFNRDALISIKSDESICELRIFLNPNYMPPNIKFNKSETDIKAQPSVSTEAELIHSIDLEYKIESQKTTCHHFTSSGGGPVVYIEGKPISALPACYFASKLHYPNQQIVKFFSEISKKGKEEELIEIVKIIEPRLESLKILTLGDVPYVHGQLNGLKHPMPINLMGEGLEKLLHIVSAIMSYENSCIFVDEIENGFFHSVMPTIWKALSMAARKYSCQIISTTHSYECITAAHEGLSEYPDDFRFIRLNRKDGTVDANLLNYKMVDKAIRSNMDIR